MWALIKDNKIEQIYQRPKSLVIGEVRYPSNMFTKYTDIDLNILHKLHIVLVLLIRK
jgi:hypothetical protein